MAAAATSRPRNTGTSSRGTGTTVQPVAPVLVEITKRAIRRVDPSGYRNGCKYCGAKPFSEGPHHEPDCDRLYPVFLYDTEPAHRFECGECKARPFPAGYHHKESCSRYIRVDLPYSISGFDHGGGCKKCGAKPYPQGPHHDRNCSRFRNSPAYHTALAHNARCKVCKARPYPAGPHHQTDCSRYII